MTPARKSRAKPSARRGLYPQIKPYRKGFLRVSELHEIYFEESGNPRGKPVVFLHGGPGGGTEGRMRRFFDPKRYRIVLFDERGCGESRPHASLVDNATWDLVEDIERLRQHLGIERWLVFGGSWGSTLALAYAETYPKAATELVLRGIFLLRRWEVEWLYQNSFGTGALFPEGWETFINHIPPEKSADIITAYSKRLTRPNRKVMIAAAKIWSAWEGSTIHLQPDPKAVASFKKSDYAAAFARIECHFFLNKGFMRSDNQLLEDICRIRHIPAIILHGRYDVLCPARIAGELHRAWPQAHLRIVPDAGHSAFESGIIHELGSATDRFAKQPSRRRRLRAKA